MKSLIGVVGANRIARVSFLCEASRRLAKRGYRVVSVTCDDNFDACLEDAESSLSASIIGSKTFIKSSFKLRIDEISSIVPYAWCLVLMEGVGPGGNVLVASSSQDVEEWSEKSIAVVPLNDEARISAEARGARVTDLEGAVEVIFDRALRDVLSLLAQEDCGECGYGSCRGLAESVLKGTEHPVRCAKRTMPLRVLVNGEQLILNPFTTKMFSQVITSLLQILKGVPRNPRRIHIDLWAD
ncbi:MAG: (Fe-S)-binding protein [Candidatus Nezhaarchaeota archaeon]|nr:(Fe-S)-binding protein [Candidatus Nezhaarchaeota archaeon]